MEVTHSLDYRALYEVEKVRSHELYKECVMLRQRIAALEKAVEMLKGESSKEQMKENSVKLANAPIKTRSHLSLFTKLAVKERRKLSTEAMPELKKIVSAKLPEKPGLKHPEAIMFHLGEATLKRFESAPTTTHIFVSKWQVQMHDLPEEFSSLSVEYIKELLVLNPPRAYSFRPFNCSYLIELHSFGATKRKFYLSTVVTYALQQKFYWPVMTFFLSNLSLDPDYLRCRIEHSHPMNYHLLFSEQHRQALLSRLFTVFSSRGFNVEAVILFLLLENSVLVRCKSNIQLANFLFLLTNYTSLEMPHIVSYNLTDFELLHVPAPFVFGVIGSTAGDQPDQPEGYGIVDLDLGAVWAVDLQQQQPILGEVLMAVDVLNNAQTTNDENAGKEIERLQLSLPTQEYLKKFRKTMTYYNLVRRE